MSAKDLVDFSPGWWLPLSILAEYARGMGEREVQTKHRGDDSSRVFLLWKRNGKMAGKSRGCRFED